MRIKYQFPFNFVLYEIRITSHLEKGTNYILNATVGDLCLSLSACVRARMSELPFKKKNSTYFHEVRRGHAPEMHFTFFLVSMTQIQ